MTVTTQTGPEQTPERGVGAEALVSHDDIDKVRHMVGALTTVSEAKWGYRNYFAPCAKDISSMDRLEQAGYVRKGHYFNGDLHYYHATENGCFAAGLDASQTLRALSG